MPNAPANELAPEASAPSERPRLVYTQAPLSLARLLGSTEDGWRIESHGTESVVSASSDVDPALLREVAERGGRVLLEVPAGDGPPQIAGVVQVRRALEIDKEGNLVAKLRSFELRATQSVLLSTGRAMLLVKSEDIELYGREVLTRAREVAKILGRMITLN